jgi:dynein heavy chain
MLINNMQYFDSLLQIGAKRSSKRKPVRQVPLFKLSAILSAPEIVTSPHSLDVYKMTYKYIRSLVETSKLFPRWQLGTCNMTQPQLIAEDEEPVVFSFYSDVVNNPVIHHWLNQLNQSVSKAFHNMGKYLEGWRKYRPLWKVDKVRLSSSLRLSFHNLTLFAPCTGYHFGKVCTKESFM